MLNAAIALSAKVIKIDKYCVPRILEPYQYLRHIFKELPKAQSVSEIEQLLPFNIDREELNQVTSG